MLLDTTKHAPNAARYSLDVNLAMLIRAAITVSFLALVVIAWVRNVNWDEFYYLSQIHDHLGTRLDRPLQTFHVHFFGWLAALPGNEMTQIALARLIMTMLLGVTVFSIWKIARSLDADGNPRTIGPSIAVIAFFSSGFVFAHGASFRTDPIASALIMSALAILMTSRMTGVQIAIVGLLGATALMITIKSVLYFPALLGAILWRADEKGIVLRTVAAAALTLGITGILYLWHSASLPAMPGKDAVSTSQNALRTTLLDAGLAPRRFEAFLWFLFSIAPVLLALVGIVQASRKRLQIVLVLFALPLILSVIFYRNAFVYFFPFIVPPLMVAVAVGAARITSSIKLNVLVALMMISAVWQAASALSEGSKLQRATIAEIHRLFPDPVYYIDQNAMISSFPRDLFFMSSWGLARYRAAGQSIMADHIEQNAPPLLLTTRQMLHRVMTDRIIADDPTLLFPDDIETLRASYVHYSGPIWLAGKKITLGDSPHSVKMPMPGTYRIEVPQSVVINGEPVNDGAVVEVLDTISVSGTAGTSVKLIWDTGVAPKPGALQTGPHYVGF